MPKIKLTLRLNYSWTRNKKKKKEPCRFMSPFLVSYRNFFIDSPSIICVFYIWSKFSIFNADERFSMGLRLGELGIKISPFLLSTHDSKTIWRLLERTASLDNLTFSVLSYLPKILATYCWQIWLFRQKNLFFL